MPNGVVTGWIDQHGNGEMSAPELAARRATGESEEFAEDADHRLRTATRRGGRPLPAELRQRLEQSFGGIDFSDVRLHLDGSASAASRAIHARAFTLGQDIFFNARGLNLASSEDQELLLHELTHVVQHLEGRLRATPGSDSTEGGLAVSSPTDSSEREAVSTAAGLAPSFDAPVDAPAVEAEAAPSVEPSSEAPAARTVENPNSNEGDSNYADPTNTRTHGSVQEQKQSQQVEAWRKDVLTATTQLEALQKQLEGWESLSEPEQEKLFTEIVTFAVKVIQLGLVVLETAMDFEGEGITFGGKLMAVGALTALVAGALGESASLDTLQGEGTLEDSERANDAVDAGFESFTAWVLEGNVGGLDDKPALSRILLGGIRMMGLLDGFMSWIASLRVEKADPKEPPTDRKRRLAAQATDDKADQQSQLNSFASRVEALREVASRGGPGRGDRGTQEAATKEEAPKSVQTADSELAEIQRYGLESAVIGTKGAVLRNDRMAAPHTWVARLDTGVRVGFQAPTREWVRLLVLDGPHKGKWGYVAHHAVNAQRSEPARAEAKSESGAAQMRRGRGKRDRKATARKPGGGGQALPGDLAQLFRPILGDAVDDVRVHTDGPSANFAESLAATAVTVGKSIYFRRGAFQAGSKTGRDLIAHELHHAVFGGGEAGVSQPGDAHEREADRFAEALTTGGLIEAVDSLLGGHSEGPSGAHGQHIHPRRALAAISGSVPSSIVRHLGDALGVSQGSGQEPGAPGVGLRELGVGGTPEPMRPPGLMQPATWQSPREDTANRKASPEEALMRVGADSPAVVDKLTSSFGSSEKDQAPSTEDIFSRKPEGGGEG